MTSYLIVDDEPIAHRIIEGYCNNLPHLRKVGNCYNGFDAMPILNSKPVDLMFLDINMPKLKGFDFLKTLQHPPRVIVTTAYKEFALEGYELNVADYLLKPFSFERFVKAVNTAIKLTQEPKPEVANESHQTSEERIFLKGDKKHYQVKLDDILFIEAYGNYCKVFLENEMLLTHEKISSFEQKLSSSAFLRVHKSFIVSIDKIKFLESTRIRIFDHKIPIGQSYKMNVMRLLK